MVITQGKKLGSLLDYSKTREIYLAFHDDCDYFGSFAIKKGFKHVFCMERSALGWSCIDPSRTDLACIILPASWSTDIIPEFKANNPTTHVIHMHVAQTDKANYPRPHLLSCVSVMQYILGVYWPLVCTPYQLYTRLTSRPPPHIKVINYDRT